jgi:hypothetical protein
MVTVVFSPLARDGRGAGEGLQAACGDEPAAVVADLAEDSGGEDGPEAGEAGQDRLVAVLVEDFAESSLEGSDVAHGGVHGSQVGQCLLAHRGLDSRQLA